MERFIEYKIFVDKQIVSNKFIKYFDRKTEICSDLLNTKFYQ